MALALVRRQAERFQLVGLRREPPKRDIADDGEVEEKKVPVKEVSLRDGEEVVGDHDEPQLLLKEKGREEVHENIEIKHGGVGRSFNGTSERVK